MGPLNFRETVFVIVALFLLGLTIYFAISYAFAEYEKRKLETEERRVFVNNLGLKKKFKE